MRLAVMCCLVTGAAPVSFGADTGVVSESAQPVAADTQPSDAETNPSTITQADFDQADPASAEGIELTQFGGFRPRLFTRPPVAATTPQIPTPLTSRPEMRRLTARAPTTPRRQRLARAPDMLGDTLQRPLTLNMQPMNPMGNELFVNAPMFAAASNARIKISEHNKALPVDRIYFNYNHFHNSVERQVFSNSGGLATQTEHIDRFTLGLERTIFGGDASVELRLPFAAVPDLGVNFPVAGPNGRFRSNSGTLGNLSVIGKALFVDAEDLVVSGGLGLEFPTGDDSSVLYGTATIDLKNESLFLQPFLAATLDNGRVFLHSFLAVDVDLTGSELTSASAVFPIPSVSFGTLRGQTLIHWDTSGGVWLLRSQDSSGITGIAGIVEFHMTSAISPAAQVGGFVPTDPEANLFVTSGAGSQTATYLTTGLHAEIASNRFVRVAGVFPLGPQDRRLFSGEFVAQVGARY